MPSVAERELDQHGELVFDILRLRAYASAKQAYDDSDGMDPKQRARLLADPMVQQVQAFEFELAQEAIDASAEPTDQ